MFSNNARMDKREFKDSVYSEISNLVKALSNSHRIEILDLLAHGEKTVDAISKETSLTFANASQHLQHLKKNRLVKTRRDKNHVHYELSNQYVYAIWKALREFSRYQIPEIDNYVSKYQQTRNIKSASYRDLEKYQPYILLDVRPEKEFRTYHIDGAIHMNVRDLHQSLDSLDKTKTIITYCRGPFCSLADDASEILQQNGFRTFKLKESAIDI